ncbi:ArsR/SmtB family transcription factor [Glycomyces buryatensis]|uniref:Helix-turn-helix transcriptional regulator n=1 Tax=Glycomyces buryatensis TaxID=2570927 RepID=A0A4V4HSJ1_9ACTN|nr:helix-turn-helix domain-containing protein [Glycomyces buryatensis]THV41886.1 helix-turn-helix transcriptional regulator [Glycomyces buryatensis]
MSEIHASNSDPAIPGPPVPPAPPSPPEPPSFLDRPESRSFEKDPRRVKITDPERMKALAHPARMAVFDFLGKRRVEGFDGATATEIAEVADMTPSAMSYHLRTLAKAGFIEEAPSRGDARERLWRLAIHSFSIQAETGAPESHKVVEREMVRAFSAQQERDFQRWLATRDETDPEIHESAVSTQGRLRLSPAEAQEFQDRFLELEEEYAELTRKRIEAGAGEDDGTYVYNALFRLFPHL